MRCSAELFPRLHAHADQASPSWSLSHPSRHGAQVLSNLGPVDVLWVAAAAGVSEELLFRGALIPATFPDWRALPPERLCQALLSL